MAMMRLRREDPRVVGSFKLHRRLGAGGMGVVYLGSDRRGQRVALKVIRPDLAEDQEFRSRFAREVSAARRIRGGCTARLVAADLDAERPWFATQYVPGPSLHDKVNEGGPLAPAQVAAIGAALAEGLVAVHDAGVVHRDLKPSNILLSPKGPRIIDFGIAWSTGASTLTHVGTAVGSPGFLAPEQVRGAAVTPATDVFSLGATLAYAATGDSPFGQGSSEVMLYRVVHEEAQLQAVPPALTPIVHACLAKAAQERPTTAQLSLRLKEIAAREARGLPQGAAPIPRPAARRVAEPAQPRTERGTGPTPRPAPPSSERVRPRPRPGGPGGTRRLPGGGTGGHPAVDGRTPPPRAPARPRGHDAAPRPEPADGRGARSTGARRGPLAGGERRRPSEAGAAERRTASRGTAPRRRPARRRPHRPGPDRRLLRQRLVVFVTVTLLVALGIAAAQGCEAPEGRALPPSAPAAQPAGATAPGAGESPAQ
ncbi:serine/threonine-protein kinase [Streptomyces sp. WMMC897]|uniref:serine/threonine-protein kinase n=1 Tax=Streptomyces sp. WMMC897 TaxID=3014782 RepID=UPI0022B66199|nr:serine/threonine-protein kinase [Streptomyces sp. WMMC897]MCZ7413332.1 protein kinase [Streptomyces sp. WMMC897]